MIAINVSRVCADAVKREKLTSGMQGVEVSFYFSTDWDGLVKTAVFEGSGESVDLLLTGASCEIPPEALKKYGGMLRVGVYGVSADGTTVIPTVYADLGIIRRGADPQKDPTTNSSLPVWAQLQAQIGDLANLTTEDKTNLVAAINEAAKSGGGSGGGKDGTGIESITYKGEDEDGGNVYTVLLTDGTSYDITAPKGATGADGKNGANGKDGSPGKDGADGKTPVKGTDYWTAADKQEIIDDIHPAYYIDLAGDYPSYTCPVSMADIKAAYEAGKVLECRCAMGQYTATLPLFIPMPSANTWIFSGAGALAAMNFPAQTLTIAIVNGAVQASDTRLASKADIPTIPTALPNPNALTVKIGSTTVTYDGSSAQTVEIADGTGVDY